MIESVTKHVAVGERDALRLAGRARGVDDRGEVGRSGAAGAGPSLAPARSTSLDDRHPARVAPARRARARRARRRRRRSAGSDVVEHVGERSCLIVGLSGESAAPGAQDALDRDDGRRRRSAARSRRGRRAEPRARARPGREAVGELVELAVGDARARRRSARPGPGRAAAAAPGPRRACATLTPRPACARRSRRSRRSSRSSPR